MAKQPSEWREYKLQAKILSTAFSIVAERTIHSFILLLGWIALFICIWITDISSKWITVIFWLGFAGLFLVGFSRFIVPTRDDVYRRVEKAGGLAHRPLSAKSDTRATGDETLWVLEENRRAKAIDLVKPDQPRFRLADHDPYGLRIIFFIFLFCAIWMIRDTSFEKIKHGAFPPSPVESADADTANILVKIIPPAYTALPELTISKSSLSSIGLMPGSKIIASATTALGTPELNVDDLSRKMKREKNTQNYSGEAIFEKHGPIKISRFFVPLFYQAVHLIPDRAPAVLIDGEISALPSGEMKIPLKVSDDFGIKTLRLRGILPAGAPQPAFGRPISVEKNLNMPLHEEKKINPVFDITGHPWAGRDIIMIIEAIDDAGNISETSPVQITLPVRVFTNPVAAKIAHVRDDILALRGNAESVTRSIEEILFRPDLYRWDMRVTLGLRAAATRMEFAQNIADIESTAGLLWETALRIENGNVSETQDDLKKTISKVQDAIKQNADPREISRLIQEMQQALLRHLQNMAVQTLKNNQQQGMQMTASLNADAIRKFMQELQKTLAEGDKNNALDKLNALQQMAEQMGASATKGMPKEISETMKAIENIQSIIAEQKKLKDQTALSEEKSLSVKAVDQKKIQNETETLSQKSPAKQLDAAALSMKEAANALQLSNSIKALTDQASALKALEQGKESLQKKLQEQMQNISMVGASGGSGDPLGRQPLENQEVDLNGTGKRKKAEEIIQKLREREGDMTRPQEERNYYERLLRQW